MSRVINRVSDLHPLEQHARLIDIADKCPVHRTLTSETDIRTVAAGSDR